MIYSSFFQFLYSLQNLSVYQIYIENFRIFKNKNKNCRDIIPLLSDYFNIFIFYDIFPKKGSKVTAVVYFKNFDYGKSWYSKNIDDKLSFQ